MLFAPLLIRLFVLAAMGKRARSTTPTMGQGTPREAEWEALSPIPEVVSEEEGFGSDGEHYSEFEELRDAEPDDVLSYEVICS